MKQPSGAVSRRGFLQMAAAASGAAGAALIAGGARRARAFGAAPGPAPDDGSSRAMLVDLTLCVGCRSCVYACQQANGWTGDPENQDLSGEQWTAVREVAPEGGDGEPRYVRTECFHCLVPSCVEACIVGALRKLPDGPVVYDPGKCIGCRYCMIACPFHVPRYQWESRWPLVAKCDFCADRLLQGKQPACAEACPTGATLFGTRLQLVEEARRRIAEQPDHYVPYIYGLAEAGGTSWLFLSDVPFQQLGFPEVGSRAPAERTRAWMGMVPGLAFGMAGFLAAAYLIEGRGGARK